MTFRIPEYPFSTDNVRRAFIGWHLEPDGNIALGNFFDRWLQRVKEHAWDEGSRATASAVLNLTEATNPYRQETDT
ncbi:hypothetical protein [Flaviflexus equikiangi]|uniref:YozE SAM-like domain-containing protein n=1 Tax=Flaviflexus equikiangi TaxID=2758573 RepID=A0ABS2TCJ9_9ACTO|nr:hypothetical protein [Flaviflexus equikiangi]MBM9432361.1 hypothetical protein [Flaviflexus equikiangi]